MLGGDGLAGDGLVIAANRRFEIDGVPFVTGFGLKDPGALTFDKSPRVATALSELFHPLERPRVFELGTGAGGGTAMISLLADPETLVSVDLSTHESPALRTFIESRCLEGRVIVHAGVDQSDKDRLRRIALDAFADQPIDVVVDDASRLYEPTLASFEALFPLLRPGGVYLVEDWRWEHALLDAMPRTPRGLASSVDDAVIDLRDLALDEPAPLPPTLSTLAMQLVAAEAELGDVVARVTVDDDWLLVERGSAELDDSFTIVVQDLAHDLR